MSESVSISEGGLGEIESFSKDLYADADPSKHLEANGDETAPMYHALAQITERYEGGKLIGRGAMKEVYRVYDRKAARSIAMAKPVSTLGEDAFDAFLREAHITARLDHPGIVKLFDMGVDQWGRPFFTMEFKKGRSLRARLQAIGKEDDFPLRKRISLVLRVSEAIAYAHSRRVLHLDIKPENIQVGEFGEVQLCDWGMGVVLQTPEGEMNPSEILLDPDLYGPLLLHSRGTKGYMAPEQQRPREPKAPGMDVYALGCVLQELVTLSPPDDEGLAEEISDPALRAIVTKARHQSPKIRYQSVDDFYQDLTRYMAGFSTSVEGAGFFREMTLFYHRNRLPCRVTGGLVVLIAILVTIFISQLQRSREDARGAQHLAEKAQAQYLSEKIEAETALDKFLAVQKESERRLQRQSSFATDSVSFLTSGRMLQGSALPTTIFWMQKELDEVIAHDPPADSPCWYQKFWLLFLTQKFDQALELRGKNLDKVSDLIPFAEKYAIAKEGHSFLPASDFARLLQELSHSVPDGRGRTSRIPLVELMIVYDLLFRKQLEDRVTIIREGLLTLNPASKDLRLDFEPSRGRLQIHGSDLMIFSFGHETSSKLSLLRFVSPLDLSLQGTRLADLDQLNGLEVLKLDIRDTEVLSLRPLWRMRSLRQLVVSSEQFTTEQLAEAPGWIKVVAK